ncbi:MAG TPA: FtsX-like permease family protein, partial [Oculatellaceae cyanobacterium]
LAKIPHVAAVVPILQVVEGHNQTIYPQIATSGSQPQQSSQGFNITVPDYIINGIPLKESTLNNYNILPTNITAGRNLLPGETGKVLLSQNSSDYFHKGVGDTVSIKNHTFEVVGIYSPAGIEDAQNVYMDLKDAQHISNSTGTITSMKIFAQTKEDVSSIASNITSTYPELIVNTAQDRLSQLSQLKSMYDSQLEIAENTIQTTQMQANVEIIIAVSATSLIVLFVMLYTVRDRTKEIGTLKAIGAGNGTIMGQFLIEGILLSLIAGTVGIAIGTIGAPFISSVLLPATDKGGVMFSVDSFVGTSSAVVVTPELMLIGFGTALALGAIGSMYPAWRAARTRPAEAMRYE